MDKLRMELPDMTAQNSRDCGYLYFRLKPQ